MHTNLDVKTFWMLPPSADHKKVLELIVAEFHTSWVLLDKYLPDGPNKTMCYRLLEDAQHRARKAVLAGPIKTLNEGVVMSPESPKPVETQQAEDMAKYSGMTDEQLQEIERAEMEAGVLERMQNEN